MSRDEFETIRKRYTEFFDGTGVDLATATIDDLIDALAVDNPVERIAYRKKANSSHKNEFARVGKNAKGQLAEEKETTAGEESKTVGF